MGKRMKDERLACIVCDYGYPMTDLEIELLHAMCEERKYVTWTLEAQIKRIKNLPLTAIKKDVLNDITKCPPAEYDQHDWVFVVKETLLTEALQQGNDDG